ncbi:MAG: T9SS type A sorting domain-containing protein [Ignavibacteria bacterium]
MYPVLIFTIVLFNFIAIVSATSQEYWSRIGSPVSVELRNCFFINAETGWISGDSGTIIRTDNGGNTWTIQNTGIYSNIEDIFFLNNMTGWALALEIFPDSTSFPGTIILSTTDGGNIWNRSMYPDTNNYMKTVYFQNANTGFLGGIPSSIQRTTNGGLTWNPTQIDSNLIFLLPVNKIIFYDQNTGYACGGFRDIAGLVWSTTNGGLVWRGVEIAPEPFFDISMNSSNFAVISGGDLEFGSSLARTSNTGTNWYYDTLGVFGLATGVSFRTPYECWMTGSYSEKFLLSVDSGYTWNSFYTLDSSALFDVTFPDTTYGYACGIHGTIYKYDRTSTSILNEYNISNYLSFNLYQNFPNPFNPKTKISYEIQVTSYEFVNLRVYDVLGNEVVELVNENQSPGSYSVEFDGSNFSSGIYFYELKIGEYSEVRKMALIK